MKENWTPLLMEWYDKNKRELPWRTESPRDPYKVWVSEVMLQQTRVEAVKAYYINWIEHFPDVTALAAAEEEAVMRQWQGLGYYSRARNLHTAVREVVENYGGHIPETKEKIRKLKGVGEYTAGAILSMAYGKRETAVDGNVLRVFARLYNVEKNILSAKVKKEITELVKVRQDVSRPGDFNEALMDLGATVCIPGQPRCEICPLCGVCMAKAAGRETEIPLRVVKKEVPVEAVMVFVVTFNQQIISCVNVKELEEQNAAAGNFQKTKTDAGNLTDGQRNSKEKVYYLLHRRPDKGLLAGMWEFPNCIGKGAEGKRALTAILAGLGIRLAERGKTGSPVKRIRHAFSHKIWQMEVYKVKAVKAGEFVLVNDAEAKCNEGMSDSAAPGLKVTEMPSDWHWVTSEELEGYNLAGPHNMILRDVIWQGI